MAAAAPRFLAHCFKMTLPVSLSMSSGRARIFIFFFARPSLALSPPLWCGSAVFSLPPPGFLSLSLSSRSRELPRHRFPGAAGVGDGSERGRRAEGRKGRKEEGREGEQIVCQT